MPGWISHLKESATPSFDACKVRFGSRASEAITLPWRGISAVTRLCTESEAEAVTSLTAISFKTRTRANDTVLCDSSHFSARCMSSTYVHGYGACEMQRLRDQASALIELLHADTAYPAGAQVLEAGCGVGAQTVILCARSPQAYFTSIDQSAASLAQARNAVAAAGLSNVVFQQADIFDLPFASGTFDHVFLSFVLEHLSRPLGALQALKPILKRGGTITVVEGDHGSAYFHPDSHHAREAINCQVALQARAGGDAMIGRRLYPLLVDAGFFAPQVSPRMVYVDASKEALVDAFIRKTFTAMIAAVRAPAIEAGLSSARDFDRGIADLYRTAEADGTFCYTFFKAIAVNR
jgi:SAM-dependent methyltransferase